MSAAFIALAGSLATLFVVMFVAMAIVEGLRFAAEVIGTILLIASAMAGIVLFWFWIAGAFA